MKKRTLMKMMAFSSAAVMLLSSTSMSISATVVSDTQPTIETIQYLNSICERAGLSKEQIRSLSTTGRNTLYYAYVNLTSLPENDEYELDYYVRYDTSILGLQGAITEPIVDETLSSFSITGTYWKKVSGDLCLDTSVDNSGTVCILAFKSVLSVNSAATVNTGVNNRTCIYTPVVQELLHNNQPVTGGPSLFTEGIYAPGDLNNDGLVSIEDCQILAGHLVGSPNSGWLSSMAKSADVNRDGSVTDTDLIKMIQYEGEVIDAFESYSDLI